MSHSSQQKRAGKKASHWDIKKALISRKVYSGSTTISPVRDRISLIGRKMRTLIHCDSLLWCGEISTKKEIAYRLGNSHCRARAPDIGEYERRTLLEQEVTPTQWASWAQSGAKLGDALQVQRLHQATARVIGTVGTGAEDVGEALGTRTGTNVPFRGVGPSTVTAGAEVLGDAMVVWAMPWWFGQCQVGTSHGLGEARRRRGGRAQGMLHPCVASLGTLAWATPSCRDQRATPSVREQQGADARHKH
ncbi:unnamed protein product [Ilex paraguariensis]|uniref:Uncharacterized protein n=1 Tax=Ilex paraguariensis TaxID=185542 RepID=A0ABC8QU97_9AQUA